MGAGLGITLGALDFFWLKRTLRGIMLQTSTVSRHKILFDLLIKYAALYPMCWIAFKMGSMNGLFAMIMGVAITMCLSPLSYLWNEGEIS